MSEGPSLTLTRSVRLIGGGGSIDQGQRVYAAVLLSSRFLIVSTLCLKDYDEVFLKPMASKRPIYGRNRTCVHR